MVIMARLHVIASDFDRYFMQIPKVAPQWGLDLIDMTLLSMSL